MIKSFFHQDIRLPCDTHSNFMGSSQQAGKHTDDREVLNGKESISILSNKKNAAESSSTVIQSKRNSSRLELERNVFRPLFPAGERRRQPKPRRNAVFIGTSLSFCACALKSWLQNKPFCTEVDGGCVYANQAAKCNFSSPFGMKFQLCFSSLSPRLNANTKNASTKSNFCSLIGVAAHTALYKIKLLNVCDISFVALNSICIFPPLQCV